MADEAGAAGGGAVGEGPGRSAVGRSCRAHEFIPRATGSSSQPGEVNGVSAVMRQPAWC